MFDRVVKKYRARIELIEDKILALDEILNSHVKVTSPEACKKPSLALEPVTMVRDPEEKANLTLLKRPKSFLFFEVPTLKVPIKLRNVIFNTTTLCNLSCVGCARTRSIKEGTWDDKHMTKETFKKVIDNLPPMSVAVLQGLGEPTLNPDFLDICKIARESGKCESIAFHTNGVTRGADFLAEVGKYADNIIVSVDSLNQLYTDKLRQGTNVEKLLRCLRGLVERDIRVSINMVVSRTNILDVVSTLGVLNEMGPFLVNLQQFEGSEHVSLSQDDNNRLRNGIEQLLPFIPNIKFPFIDFSAQSAAQVENDAPLSKEPSLLCSLYAPALSPYITQDGYMTPCCRTEDPTRFGHSNLTKQSFAEIWRSDVVRRYVHRFIEKGDDICRLCDNRRRDLFSADDGPGDVAEAVEKVLQPAVDFAKVVGDDEQAAQFQLQFARSVSAISSAIP